MQRLQNIFDWQIIFKPKRALFLSAHATKYRFHVEDAAGRFLLSHIIFLFKIIHTPTHILPILTRKTKKIELISFLTLGDDDGLHRGFTSLFMIVNIFYKNLPDASVAKLYYLTSW